MNKAPSTLLGKIKFFGRRMLKIAIGTSLVIVESRDLYYRSTWAVDPLDDATLNTGDVLAICNRWYTVPNVAGKAYSFACKLNFRATWDDVAVVVVLQGMRHILFVDYDTVKLQLLDDFLKEREPRGVAVRRLNLGGDAKSPSSVAGAAVLKPSEDVSRVFIDEVMKLKPSPWYVFSASFRTGDESEFYALSVQKSALEEKIRKIRGDPRRSKQALQSAEEQLSNLDIMRKDTGRKMPNYNEFRLFNGSLVASFLATFDYLDRSFPPPTRYVPQDFAHDLPLKHITISEPVVIYRS